MWGQEISSTWEYEFAIADSTTPFKVTNIEFLNGVIWESKFDDTHWSIVNGVWNGSAWDSVGSPFALIWLQTIGTWANGYAPTKVRLTFEAQ